VFRASPVYSSISEHKCIHVPHKVNGGGRHSDIGLPIRTLPSSSSAALRMLKSGLKQPCRTLHKVLRSISGQSWGAGGLQDKMYRHKVVQCFNQMRNVAHNSPVGSATGRAGPAGWSDCSD